MNARTLGSILQGTFACEAGLVGLVGNFGSVPMVVLAVHKGGHFARTVATGFETKRNRSQI